MSEQEQGTGAVEHGTDAVSSVDRGENYAYCGLPLVPERALDRNVNPDRAELIRVNDKKWVNGTVLHYCFFDGRDEERDVLREAFGAWKDLGIGLEFQEVGSPAEAEVKIGFVRGDGAWSFVGRDVIDLAPGPDERTMNFGWDLTQAPEEIDTAVHEIGHTLRFPHEHQNPNAGIVWDEEAVYAALAEPPNSWPRERTHFNIIRKIAPDTVQGSEWDPDSVMHYPFRAGLIREPARYTGGLVPAGGLSDRDKTWVRTFYPPLSDTDYEELRPVESVRLSIAAGEQRNFVIRPQATRYYEIRTFGASDTVMVLFEDLDGEPRYLTADDDSGEDRNAHIRVKLLKGREYVLRVRLFYAARAGETAVMMW
jgi:hypothetical protein